MSLLVTGATGTIGSEILRLLSNDGRNGVAALVRSEAKACDVVQNGAKAIVGDFEDISSLCAATQGIDTVILITSANPESRAQASNAIHAAARTGVRKIVRVSAIKADIDGPTDNTRQHGHTEAELIESGVTHVILRPNLFMQNFFLVPRQIVETGSFSFAAGDGQMGMVDTRDVAACAVQCAATDRWDGQALELTGPDSISYTNCAEILSKVSGKLVGYQPVTPKDLHDTIERAGWGRWLAEVSRDYSRAYSENWGNFITGNVKQIRGCEPRSFEMFAREVFANALPSSQGTQVMAS